MKSFGIYSIALIILFPVLHEFLAVTIGLALGHLPEIARLERLVDRSFLSPARAMLFITSLSDIQPVGVSIRGDLGDLLHRLAPSIFQSPLFTAQGAWISAVIEPDSSPLARFTTRGLTEIVTVYLGLAIIRLCREPLPLKLFGAIILIQGVLALSRLPLSTSTEDIGLGFLIEPLVSGNRGGYELLLGAVAPLTLSAGLILLAALPLLLTGYLARRQIKVDPQIRRPPFVLVAFLCVSLALPSYLGVLPHGSEFGQVQVLNRQLPSQKVESLITVPNPSTQPVPISRPETISTPPKASRKIGLHWSSEGEFQLSIRGHPARVRGVHYYFGHLLKLDPIERESILRQDLAVIQQAGFNAVTGWEEDGFDEQFLHLAQEYGMGVIKPISLEPAAALAGSSNVLITGDFLDPTLRAQIKERFRLKVQRVRSAPSLLLWNVGEAEPLEQMTRYYQRTPEQVQAAADLIVEMAELAHSTDPHHPSIVSEPQDWYLRYYQSPIARVRNAGVDPFHFLVIGGNFYSQSKLKVDLQRSKTRVMRELKVGFAVSEWAPFGVDRVQIPHFRSRMATEVSKATPISVAYVFNPAADPLNPTVSDPTQAVVTGLALTDAVRNDVHGALAALAKTQGRQYFATALRILKADREQGFGGVPISSPIPYGRDQAYSLGHYFVVHLDGKLIAYRWREKNKHDSETAGALLGPEVMTDEVKFDSGERIIRLRGSFLKTYLEGGGPSTYGRPINDAYESIMNGQPVLRQDFQYGWSLVLRGRTPEQSPK